MNLWQRFVNIFSAKSTLRRAQFRAAAGILGDFRRKYEGASSGRRTKNWKAQGTSANAEIEASIEVLRNRSRQLVRDNPFAARAIQVITSNVVGWGVYTQVRAAQRQQNSSGVNNSNAKLSARLSANWKAWAETKEIDFDKKHNLYAMQRLVMRSVAESGEVLIRKRKVERKFSISADGSSIEIPPIELQILEADFLDSRNIFSQNPANGNFIIMGIEFTPQGKIVAYHLYKEHPGNSHSFGELRTSTETVRVPAEEILHVFRTDRPGQIRGVAWLAPIMLRLKDFDEYEDAQLVRQKIAACFSVFVKDIDGALDGDPGEGELGEKVEPGMIEFLPPGKDVSFASPPGVEGYAEHSRIQLHAIASGLGLTYESLTGDLSQVNFSSARMGFLEMNRNIEEWREHILISQFLDGAFKWWKEGAALIGEDSERAVPVYTAPRREMIDPSKETAALKDAVRSGFMTMSEAVRTQGYDPETHFQEMARDFELLDKLGLVLDTDPRQDKPAQQDPAPQEPDPQN